MTRHPDSSPAAPNPADVSLAIVIPTRNRADLAIAACRSLLQQRGDRHRVYVSDNSTRDEDVRQLAEFCRTCGDSRVVHLRPPEPLTMPSHWDWAIEQAIEQSSATHFTIHYDRKVTKAGAVDALLDVVAQRPGMVVTHLADHVSDVPPPATLWQAPWAGRLYEIRTSRVLELSAQCMIDEMGHAFPILSNCVVPRETLLAIRGRFGSICNSTGPDSCFTYRFCAMNEGYLHLDWATAVIYAPQRSNGLGYLRGTGGDFANFVESWGERPWLDAAPIPGLNLGQNMLFHEYELVRRTAAATFPPIHTPAYLAQLASALHWIQDPRFRRQAQALLEKHGWSEPAGESSPAPRRRPLRNRLTPAALAASLIYRLRFEWDSFRNGKRVVLFLADHLGLTPETITGYTFTSDQQALRYALAYPRRRVLEHEYLKVMQPREVPGGGAE